MRDIQFITLADKIIVNSVQDKGSSVTLSVRPIATFISSIEITDEDIGLVIVPANAITILSSTELRFTKPAELSSSNFEQVLYKFITSEVTNTDRSELIFNPTKRVVSVSGTQKLIQQIVKVLLTNSSSNVYNPEEGGDVMSFLGEVSGSPDPQTLIAPVEDAVQKTKEFIIKEQLGKSIPASERLLSLSITDYNVSLEGYLDIKIRVQTLSGDSINIPLSI